MATNDKALLDAANAARKLAYAPYSRFTVGAALQTDSGVFVGCNVENISFGLTICAERAAVAAAISHGQRGFAKLALVANSARPSVPCGACRQVLAEFNPELQIVSSTAEGKTEEFTLRELLPLPKQGILEVDV